MESFEVDPTSSFGRSVDADVYNELVYYFKYATSAYSLLCLWPNGNKLVSPFSNPVTDIQGFVARDDTKQEIVVALRGSMSLVDFLLDIAIILVPLLTPGVSAPFGAKVHSGFLIAWNSVVAEILALLTLELRWYPGYSIVTTGHSLGGALATLAAISLKCNFPDAEVRTYSYGAPRIGNEIFAAHVNEMFGRKAHRVVHTTDGVPTIISTRLGYYHHGIEYWISADPPSEKTTLQCSSDGEDPSCSASIPTRGINPAHWRYFDILATTPFCL